MPGPLVDNPEVVGADERREAIVASALSVGRSLAWITVLLLVYAVAPATPAEALDIALWCAAGLVTLVVVVVWQVRATTRSSRPLSRAIEGVAVVATVVLVVFATTYRAISHRDPAALSEPLDRIGALYFTLTTLATVGYGDIDARSNPARVVVMIQIVVDVVVLGVAVKVLLGTARRRGEHLFAAHHQDRPAPPSRTIRADDDPT